MSEIDENQQAVYDPTDEFILLKTLQLECDKIIEDSEMGTSQELHKWIKPLRWVRDRINWYINNYPQNLEICEKYLED